MKKERFRLVPFVAVMLKKDNKIILTKRIKSGWGNGEYALPGGSVDGQETIRQASAREVKEELGVTVREEDLKVIHVMHIMHRGLEYEPGKTHFEGIGFFLQTEKWEGELKNMEPHIHEFVDWFDLNNLPENIVSEFKQVLEKISKNEIYSEHGW